MYWTGSGLLILFIVVAFVALGFGGRTAARVLAAMVLRPALVVAVRPPRRRTFIVCGSLLAQ